MPKQNLFQGIKVAYDPLGAHYPVNTDNPYFDHFVYQQIIDDGIKASDKLRLCCKYRFWASIFIKSDKIDKYNNIQISLIINHRLLIKFIWIF